MSSRVNSRRPYDSSRRRAQAAENRAAILAAARRLFLADGYAATTMVAIASDAGVSVETIYKAFGNKSGLLKALFDEAVGRDDEPIPKRDRTVVDRMWAEPDPEQKLRLYGEIIGRGAARVQPVQLMAREAAASDAAAAEVYDNIRNERLGRMVAFAEFLRDSNALRSGVTVDEARDVLWTYNSAEIWELLVVKRGWKPARYGRWIGDALVAALLERPHPTTSR
jgi:AcrR family transcriptional regulator